MPRAGRGQDAYNESSSKGATNKVIIEFCGKRLTVNASVPVLVHAILYANAIATLTFGPVERGVCFRNQHLRIGAILRKRGDAQRYRNSWQIVVAVADHQGFDCRPKSFGSMASRNFVGLWQHDHKLFTAKTANDLVAVESLAHQFTQGAKNGIAGVVPVVVVKPLEMISIERDEAERLALLERTSNLAPHVLQEIAPIVEARKGISDRLIAKLIAQFNVGDGETDLLGALDREYAHRGKRREVIGALRLMIVWDLDM